MATMLENQTVGTKARNEMVEVTERLKKLVGNIRDGMLIVYVPHTTAGVTIQENADPDVKHDLLTKLSQLIPEHEGWYKHSEGNSDSHLKTALVGNSVTVLIEGGKLVLGQW